jgi:hypothetical protein
MGDSILSDTTKTKGNARSSGYEKAEDGWYVESAACVDAMLAAEPIVGRSHDPACGGGNIPSRFQAAGLACYGSDLRQRADRYEVLDFLGPIEDVRERLKGITNCVFNPPFSLAQQFVERALDVVPGKVIVLQRLAWLESQRRREFFLSTGLSHVWVHSCRISMPPGGQDIPATGGAVAYAWMVWRRTPPGQPATLGWLA